MKNEILIALLLTTFAGLSTGIGSLISLFIKDLKSKYLNFFLGFSAGVMIYISLVELLPESIKCNGFVAGNLAFFGGIFAIMLIDFLIPHNYIQEKVGHHTESKKAKKLMTVGILTAIGIGIHNFPEGLAVFMTSLSDTSMGIPLAFAIAIHNIPEGIAIAMPVYFATKSHKKAFWLSMFSGLTEPIGAIIGILILMPFLSESLICLSLAFVGGIMVFISFDELLPTCHHKNHSHESIAGTVVGMAIMALSLHLL